MTLRRCALPIAAALALMGCQPVWIKNGEQPGEFADAVYVCNAPERIGENTFNIVREMNRRAILSRCIAARGFRQVDPRDVPAGTIVHDDVAPGVRPYRPS